MAAIQTRVYTASRSSLFKDQLNIWCDRLGFGNIRFVASLTDLRDEQGHQLYQAFPIFPYVEDLGQHYVAQGRTEQEAYHLSLSRIPFAQLSLRAESVTYNFDYRNGFVVAKPCLIRYGADVQLTNVVGYGTSRRSAEERVAEMLLGSGHYCFYH